MSKERELLQQQRKREKDSRTNEEFEKIEIAMILCNSCTIDQMRYLKSHATIFIRKMRKNDNN